MKIAYIYQDEYPWDVRVEKIINSLTQFNFNCKIISRNRSGLPRKEQITAKLEISRLPFCRFSLLTTLINTPAFFSPFWLIHILHHIKSDKIDLLIVRDLPLSLTAIIAGRLTSKPVVLDMAENYPAMISDTWKYRGPKGVDYLIRNPFFLKILEKYTLPKFDHVLVVSKHSKKRIESMKVLPENISIVSNTPVINKKMKSESAKLADIIKSWNAQTLLYVGGLEESRGLDIVIRSLPKVISEFADFKFIIVGQGSSRSFLEKLSEKLGVERSVYFAGWQPHENIDKIIKSSDICIIPHYVTEHINTTIPNKIFDYMLQKKPVIVTHSKVLVEIINEAHCGLHYQHDQPEQLETILLKLLKNPRLREQLGETGFEAVKKKYNWENDEKTLILSIEKTIRRDIRV